MTPMVAIIGRPNVGKSTLFNRLVGTRKAIVEDLPGVTRDRLYGRCERYDRVFDVVDTGGFDPDPDDALLRLMKEQVEIAIEQADAIIFLMDLKDGLTPADREICRMLRRREKPFFLAVNKADSPEKDREGQEFHELGADLYFIAATRGRGVPGLMDEVIASLVFPEEEEAPPAGDVPYVAVVGRPNVGKSTLINKLLGENRLLTSELPGTTRDSVDTRLETADGKSFVLVDTAGMRRKRSVHDAVEYYSIVRAVRSIERAHAVFLLLDAAIGMEEQDVKIANLIEDRGRPLALVFNKWDKVEKDTRTAQRYTKTVHERYPSLAYVPTTFVSALSGKGVNRLLGLAESLKQSWETRVATGELNRFIGELTEKTPPPLHHHRPPRIYFVTQAETCPPTFVFQVNAPGAFLPPYRRFLHNRLRERYVFSGSPIRLVFRKRGE